MSATVQSRALNIATRSYGSHLRYLTQYLESVNLVDQALGPLKWTRVLESTIDDKASDELYVSNLRFNIGSDGVVTVEARCISAYEYLRSGMPHYIRYVKWGVSGALDLDRGMIIDAINPIDLFLKRRYATKKPSLYRQVEVWDALVLVPGPTKMVRLEWSGRDHLMLSLDDVATVLLRSNVDTTINVGRNYIQINAIDGTMSVLMSPRSKNVGVSSADMDLLVSSISSLLD